VRRNTLTTIVFDVSERAKRHHEGAAKEEEGRRGRWRRLDAPPRCGAAASLSSTQRLPYIGFRN
jgi:hypothetical protein